MHPNLDIEQLTIKLSVNYSKTLFSSLSAKVIFSIMLHVLFFCGAFVIQAAYQPSDQRLTSASKATSVLDTNNILTTNIVRCIA